MPEDNEELETTTNDWKMQLGKMVVGLVAGAIGTIAAEKVWDMVVAGSTADSDDEDTEEE